ncbi:MAG: hypothetical protein OEV28_14330, partial [Nitrospirota bacterium]|nr:hypothetical protein [Nitrospirota bacterium]
MKKILAICLAVVFVGLSAKAYAVSGDIGLGLSTEPAGGFGSGIYVNAGVNVTQDDLKIKDLPKELSFRADVGYTRWKYSWSAWGFNGFDLTYSRIPIFAGA